MQTTVLGFVMMAANISGIGGPSIPTALPEVKEAVPLVQNKKTSVIERSLTVEEYLKNYFSDIPIMVEIAKCESRFRQYDKNGKVLRGVENSLDTGVMQINEYYHNEDSEKLGYDLMTIEGNTSYARYLFERHGVKPWKSSAKCWAKTVAYSEYKDLAVNK